MVKIAVVTKDGERISSHFGTAPFYHVFSVEDNRIVGKEVREKPYNPDPRHTHSGGQRGGGQHGRGRFSAHDKYEPVRDCQVLIAGGMGENAYRIAQALGIEVLLTGGKIQDAVEKFLAGKLESDSRRIH